MSAIRAVAASACVLLAMAEAGDAAADSDSRSNAAGLAPRAAPAPAAHGLLVLSSKTATEAAWPLAKELYARPTLRPSTVDEGQARVLAGEAPGANAPVSLRELGDTRDAIRADDAPSRQLLAAMASRFHVRGIVVVSGGGMSLPEAPADAGAAAIPAPDPVVARVFVTTSEAFDAARYTPDTWPSGGVPVWTNTAISLDRAYGAAPPAPTERSAAVTVTINPNGAKPGADTRRPFYSSPWFWGAIAAAAFTGAAIFFATQDASSDTIHLQMQVPR